MAAFLCAIWWVQAAPAAGGGSLSMLLIIAVFAIFYFLLFVPQQRRQKRIQKMHRELKTGDRVITSGGIRGTIVSIKDDVVQLRVPPDSVKLELVRSAVAHVVPEDGANKS